MEGTKLKTKSETGGPAPEAPAIEWPSPAYAGRWAKQVYNPDAYWGGFPEGEADEEQMWREHPWALGPFRKHTGNPVLAPTPGAWDTGRIDGGVHNGAVIVRDGVFYYVYRGERPLDVAMKSDFDYICDIGVATSRDGIHFTKDKAHSPFFRTGPDHRYSYEDVNIVEHEGTYYLFCNQWDWEHQGNHRINGTFLATSRDLLRWEKRGIVFPNATRTHRNGVVLHDPHNRALKVNGKFVMYINDGLIAYSDDLVHWESRDVKERWPGGEGCLALGRHSEKNPDDIVLFTGGNHTGHFYAIGEVLFSAANPEQPRAWLPRPVLKAEPRYPWESGRAAEPPHRIISTFRDCIFFNALTLHQGRWWLYYGGSEYYTCLATAL
ncbi:MAG TPA: hypothetical protein VL221_13350 [Bacteroidota bacterium]|nr:hypothetical protein [Bacteroidota bacterium]